MEERFVRKAIQCREEVGCVVILCSPEGLGDILQWEPRVPAHGLGSKAPALPVSLGRLLVPPALLTGSSGAKVRGCRRAHTPLHLKNLPCGCKLHIRVDKRVLVPVLIACELCFRNSPAAVVFQSRMSYVQKLTQMLKYQRFPTLSSLHPGRNPS